MKIAVISILVSFLLFACSKSDRCGCFDSNGETITETRSIEPFSELEVDNVFDITLHLNSNPEIKIEVGKNLLKGIKTTVENNRLIIKNNNICNWTRKYNGHIKIDISCDSVSYIKLYESCDIRCTDTIRANEFRFDNYADISKVDMNFVCITMIYAVHAGTGDTKLHGSAKQCILWSMGYGYFYLNDFKTDYCNIMSNSTGNIYVNVSKEIEATIKNSGNVYYTGNPYSVITKGTGKGKLIKE